MAAEHPHPKDRRRRWRLIAVAAAFALAAAILNVTQPTEKDLRVIDGDVLDLAGERIRLFGIDAPEGGQSCGPVDCGKAATDALVDILSTGPIRCEPVGTDRYGRSLSRCRAGRLDVNREMVRRGMAWAYHQYADDYVRDEKAAKASGIGIWQYPSQPAWEYRAEKLSRSAQKAPGGCAIKGNISASGKIYHPPSSHWYAKTRIDTERGERWFCSEAEAVAAGWRPQAW